MSRVDSMSRILWIVAGVAATVAVAAALAGHFTSDKSPNRLVVDPPIVRFGEIGQGQSAAAQVRIWNHTTRPFTISRIQTSCSCLTLEIDRPLVCVGESIAGQLRLDLKHEPRFTGGLHMTIELFDESGKEVLIFEAEVRVNPRT